MYVLHVIILKAILKFIWIISKVFKSPFGLFSFKSINSNIKTLLFSSRISRDDVFSFYEQYALDNYERNFGIAPKDEGRSSSGPGQSLVKTLYKPGTEGMYAEDDIMYRAENISNKSTAAYATAIALALIGCLAMIVSSVSFIIFSKLF